MPDTEKDRPIIHKAGCGWATGPYCTCGADPERPAEKDAAECDCESMGGRFGSHRPECPWQVAFEAQLAAEKDVPTMSRAECQCPDDCDCDGRFACEVQPTGCDGTWTCELVVGHGGWHQDGSHRWAPCVTPPGVGA